MKRRDFLRSAAVVPAAVPLASAPRAHSAVPAGADARAPVAALGYLEARQQRWQAWRVPLFAASRVPLRARVLGFAGAGGTFARLDLIAWHPHAGAALPFYAWAHRADVGGCCATSASLAFALGDATLEFRVVGSDGAVQSLRLGGDGVPLLPGTYALVATADGREPAWHAFALDAEGRAFADGPVADALVFALEPAASA